MIKNIIILILHRRDSSEDDKHPGVAMWGCCGLTLCFMVQKQLHTAPLESWSIHLPLWASQKNTAKAWKSERETTWIPFSAWIPSKLHTWTLQPPGVSNSPVLFLVVKRPKFQTRGGFRQTKKIPRLKSAQIQKPHLPAAGVKPSTVRPWADTNISLYTSSFQLRLGQQPTMIPKSDPSEPPNFSGRKITSPTPDPIPQQLIRGWCSPPDWSWSVKYMPFLNAPCHGTCVYTNSYTLYIFICIDSKHLTTDIQGDESKVYL